MTQSIKRKTSSIPYSFTKLYRKITKTKPSSFVVSIIAIAFAIFLFGGGLYSIIMKPLPAIYYGGRFLFLYPQLSEQFVTDSIVATILYSLGVIGLIAMYQSTKYAYKPRQAYMMFIIGVTLLLLAYIYLETTIQMKVSGT